MSILGAMQAGVSALGAQSSAMGAVSDNIANMNTIGYKNNNVSFSTLVTKQVSSSHYSTGGVQSHSSQSIDAQGLLSSVSSVTSLAVSGSGFFVVNSLNTGDGTWAYTRAGDFLKDETGYLVNSGGYYAQAWSLMPWDGNASAATVEINGLVYMKAYKNELGETVYINDNIVDGRNLRGINLSNIGGTATPTTQISFGANLPSGATVGQTYSVSTLIYDSLGNPSNISLSYTKENANSWGLNTSIPSGVASINMYTKENDLVYSSVAQMEFSDIPAIGSTITINGTTFEFVDGNAPATGNVAVDLNGVNAISDVLDNFMSVIRENIRDAGRFSIEDNSIIVRQSVTGDEIDFDCSGTLACVQSSANIDKSSGIASGKFTLSAINDSLKNCAYIDINELAVGNSITIDDIQFIFDVNPNPGAETPGVVYTGYKAGDSMADAVEQLVSVIQGSGVAEPERFVASGNTLRIIPTATGGNIKISEIDIAADGYKAVFFKNGPEQQIAPGPNTYITNTFVYNGIDQVGSLIPAVMFNSDGTPKTINVQDMSINWANGAQNMTGKIADGDGVRISINMGEENVSSGLTNLSGEFSTGYINQDGATFGSYSGVTVDESGVVTAVFSNGETRPIAIIPLALFTNANGMGALNNNVWIATTESGNPLLTRATTGGSGEIVSSSLESSTVDLATEFSNMIIVQRAYSAAGKIITTSDEMLQELTNLV